MAKALRYIGIIAKNTMEHRKKIVFQMLNHVIFLLFSLYLYKHVYELLPSMQLRLPFPNAIWSMSMYFIIFWLGLRELERDFRQDIVSGNIEVYLLRPLGYVYQKVLMRIGQGLVPFASALILSVVLDYCLVGLPFVAMPLPLWILSLFIIFILSQILTCILFVLCGLSGFWLENSEPMYFIVSKFIMIFGGAWVPVAFFPHVLQVIAEFSPFGASVGLSYAMYPDFATHFVTLVLTTLAWIIICGGIALIVSQRAMRKLSVNG
jgi:ABC-2 type transport system permease protein